MAKKNSPASMPTDSAASSSNPPRRRRAAAKRATDTTVAPSTANDRDPAMPEPAGQRVTPANTSVADSVTFVAAQPTYEQIAEAAYQRYLSRGATDGRDFDDWIEAEQQLKTR
jgi:hypothetical protein